MLGGRERCAGRGRGDLVNREARLIAVLDLLAETGEASVEDVIKAFGVSPATARRDLDTLAEQQLLSRTRGGALAQSVAYDLPLRYKKQQHADAKLRIAACASSLVSRGAVIGLAGGTTTTAIAAALSSRSDLMEPSPYPNLTVVTNAINIAAHLLTRPQIKTVVTGGVVHSRSYELVGPFSNAVLDGITMDIAFIGVNGIDAVMGATEHDEREANLHSAMAVRAGRAIIVADSSKIGVRAFAALTPKTLNTLITDSGITDEQRAALEDVGIEVILA